VLRVLNREEELQSRREDFAKLKPGSLFDLGQLRFFIVAKKIDEEVWEVIELTKTNKEKIVSGQPFQHSHLPFDYIDCLNLHL